jgi:sialic acid synthase SpsE
MRIGDIVISESSPLVIPEIGINHGGDINVAKAMVRAAARAGAHIVKHQTHIVEDEMCQAAKKVVPGNSEKSIYEIMKECSLNEKDEREMMEYCEDLGMVFLSTPFSRAAADRLARFNVQAFKIGSGELNNYPLIDHVAQVGKPMIISTGMNDIEAIKRAVDIVEKRGVPYALMHTTNLYPTKPEQVRLGAMLELKNAFPNCPVGLSDHTVNNLAAYGALSLGAQLVERHFTDTKERIGPDIVCSMDEEDLRRLIEAAKDIPKMLGGHKDALKEEQVTINFAYASVVTIKAIKKNEKFSRDNLWVKRPGTGDFLAKDYESLLGKTASMDIPEDVMLEKMMVF